MFTEFVFIRHGETDANRDGLLQGGKVDMPLNENGQKQAAAVAECLRDEHFDFSFASPLIRARQTMEIIAAAHSEELVPQYDDALREWNCGDLDGLHWCEIKEKYPVESLAFSFERVEVQMPNGECGLVVQSRVENFLKTVLEKCSGKRVLLVAHGGVLQRVVRFLTGPVCKHNMLPLADNASITTFRFNHSYNAWQLTALNRIEHLKNLPLHQSRVS